jgi:hypothetical protein
MVEQPRPAPLAALAAALLLGACHPPPYDVYSFVPKVAAVPAALPADAAVRIVDISDDPRTTYEKVRADLGGHTLVGTFTALNREGTAKEPLLPAIRGFAQSKGSDVAIVSCGITDVDGAPRRICAGQLLRLEAE